MGDHGPSRKERQPPFAVALALIAPPAVCIAGAVVVVFDKIVGGALIATGLASFLVAMYWITRNPRDRAGIGSDTAWARDLDRAPRVLLVVLLIALGLIGLIATIGTIATHV